MAIDLHSNCKVRLKEKLLEALASAEVSSGSFLSRSSLAQALPLDDILQKNGTSKKRLDNYVSDSPVSDFVSSYLAEQVSEHLEYDSEASTQKLSEISEYQDLNSLSDELVEKLDSLPWQYCFTFRLNSEIARILTDEITGLAEDIRLVKGNVLAANFPPMIGTPTQQGGLLGRLLAPPNWEVDTLYVQIFVEGYIGKYTDTVPKAKALDTLKSVLGLLIATRVLRVRHSYLSSNAINSYYIHQQDDGWLPAHSAELDSDISKTINELVVDDLDGRNDTDNQKSGFVKHWLKTISEALRHKKLSNKIRLAGQWLFDSYCGQNELLSYIQTMVSLEILLGDKAGSDKVGLGELLRNRCAYLIGHNQSQREEILSDFQEIYTVRSSIVHRGQSKLSKDERVLFFKLQWMVRRVIQEELKLLVKNE